MKILQINTAADSGGAAMAMVRLHQGLLRIGDHRSHILARLRKSPQQNVLTIPDVLGGRHTLAHRFLNNARMQLDAWFGLPQVYGSTKRILRAELFGQADIVQLHNLHGWYFNYELLPELSQRKPVIWTLHDMWAFTGHCAYSYDCGRWQEGCYDCPLLRGDGRRWVEPKPTLLDRTSAIWRKKRALYGQSHLHIVAPSEWLAGQARCSILGAAHAVQCIPYGLDLDLYHPVEQGAARQALGLPPQARVILFIAANVRQKRKGLVYLLDALQQLQAPEPPVLLTIGRKPLEVEPLPGFGHVHLGQLSDETVLNLAYSAADVFVSPALADNLPLVVMESLASGTPVVCFDVGGLPEMVRHMETGYLARHKDAADLAVGIRTILDGDALHAQMRQSCRSFAAAHYALEDQARRYVELYEQALHAHQLHAPGGRR